jgi:hypothetical protein
MKQEEGTTIGEHHENILDPPGAGLAALVTACGGSSTAAAQPNGSATGSSNSSHGL